MFVTGLVNLYTLDIEAGLHFYGDLLGFTETFRPPAEGVPEHVELQLGGFTVGLGTVEAAKRVHGVEATPGSPAMVLVVWTDNVDTACDELAAAQVGSAPGPGKGATSADCGDVLRPAALACSRELTPRVPARRGRTGSTRRR